MRYDKESTVNVAQPADGNDRSTPHRSRGRPQLPRSRPGSETPLRWAASSDDMDAAAALIDGGADIEVPNGSIGTPLDNVSRRAPEFLPDSPASGVAFERERRGLTEMIAVSERRLPPDRY